MSFLKSLRKNRVVNKLVRGLLKNVPLPTGRLQDIQSRWPPSGIVNCSFNNIPFKMLSNCDDVHVNFFYYGFKYQEEADLKLFIQLASHSYTIVDIGANTGLYSILAAKKNPASQVYAFEPHPANVARMKLNVELNGLKNVIVIPEALGEQTGKIDISVPADNSITDVASCNIDFSQAVYPHIQWKTKRVPLNTVDNFRKTLNGAIDLIKCDVETFEISVFNGALEVLSKDRPVIIFEAFAVPDRISFFNSILKEYNYYLYLILEQGLVYSQEGMIDAQLGLNYLISPVKPAHTFTSYKDNSLPAKLLLRRF
jgi:FkbM family methyltransferase